MLEDKIKFKLILYLFSYLLELVSWLCFLQLELCIYIIPFVSKYPMKFLLLPCFILLKRNIIFGFFDILELVGKFSLTRDG